FAAYNEIEDRAEVSGTTLIEGFDMAAYADMPKPVVIAVISTWATRKYGGPTILLDSPESRQVNLRDQLGKNQKIKKVQMVY
nr:hypothetical protein [Tanacetum cinerariifolium]